jgi:iron complex transport system ATP-binding protein
MLKAENITYHIGQKNILQNVCFYSQPGELLVILGANGAGKSTLIKCLAQMIIPHSGHITWKHKPIHTYNTNTISKQRSVLTQQTMVGFEFSVYEIVMMGRYPYFKSIPATSDVNAVNRAIEQNDINLYKKRIYQSLSGGEQQRTHLARVMAQLLNDNTEAKLILLDEPLNNLDIKHQYGTLQTIKNFCHAGNIGIMILHDINLAAMYADKLLILKNGQVLAFGSPQEVMKNEILSDAYDFPVSVQTHPQLKVPLAYFNYKPEYLNQKTHAYDTQIHAQ